MENLVFTLALKQLPFMPDCNQIIYIEGYHNEPINDLIRRHFWDIRKCFSDKGFDFCYIPFLKKDLLSKDRLHYNAPYAKSSAEADFMVNDNFILEYLISPDSKNKVPPSLLYYHPDLWDNRFPDAKNQFRGIMIFESSFNEDVGLSNILQMILDDIEDNRDECLYRKIEEDPWLVSECDFADDRFDIESKRLMEEIGERIEKLRRKGIEDEVFERLFFNRKRKLSRMRITKDYRIFLTDYFGMEIEMGPLPKSLFLLFLKHPEGIIFSYLPDFRDELFDIYRKIRGPFFNEVTAKRSVNDVTNPIGNSINENCSRVRAAFVSKFDDHLAQYYYITGVRGEVKKIALPRTLVEWE